MSCLRWESCLPSVLAEWQAFLSAHCKNGSKRVTRYVPDLARLSAHKDRIVLAVGHDTRELLAGGLAERLGTQVIEFPGDHGGYGAHPAAFAATLREVLE
jgi:hypothetical protein